MIIDIAVGGIIYTVLSLLFDKNFNLWILSYSIFITLFPDLDGFLFLMFRRKFNLVHHKLIHWPIIIIPLIASSVYFLTKDYYWTSICIVGLTFHLIHDSLPPDPGPQWLFPFDTNHYCINDKGKIVSRTRTEFFEVVRLFWEKRGKKHPTVGGEIKMALKPTLANISLLWVAYEANLIFWLTSI